MIDCFRWITCLFVRFVLFACLLVCDGFDLAVGLVW